MKYPLVFIIIIILVSCSTADHNTHEELLNLTDNDTLYIYACKSDGCGGEWGCCLELNKIYKTTQDKFEVSYIKGIRIWETDTIRDSSKVVITKDLTNTDQKAIIDYIEQIRLADTMMITSNGPNRFAVKSKNYFKSIDRDNEQWKFYKKLTDTIYY